MTDRLNIDIHPRLVSTLVHLASVQDRDPNELIEDALLRYLRELGVEVELGPRIDRPIREIYVEPPPDEPDPPRGIPLVALFEQIDQGQRERGVEPLAEEDAMLLVNEELHAMRREGGAGRSQRVER